MDKTGKVQFNDPGKPHYYTPNASFHKLIYSTNTVLFGATRSHIYVPMNYDVTESQVSTETAFFRPRILLKYLRPARAHMGNGVSIVRCEIEIIREQMQYDRGDILNETYLYRRRNAIFRFKLCYGDRFMCSYYFEIYEIRF